MIEDLNSCEHYIELREAILVVEDSLEDYEVMSRNFRNCGLGNPLYHCVDGDEALDYLFHRGEFADPGKAPRPTVILLDLSLPGTGGCEVLAAVKADLMLRQIPIIVLSSSADERDIQRCYDAGADSYVLKPVCRDGFMDAIQRLPGFWFQITVVRR